MCSSQSCGSLNVPGSFSPRNATPTPVSIGHCWWTWAKSWISLLWDKRAKDFLTSCPTSSAFSLGVGGWTCLLMTMSLTSEREFQCLNRTPVTCSSWFTNPILKLISDEYAIVWWVNTTVSAQGEVSNNDLSLKRSFPILGINNGPGALSPGALLGTERISAFQFS